MTNLFIILVSIIVLKKRRIYIKYTDGITLNRGTSSNMKNYMKWRPGAVKIR